MALLAGGEAAPLAGPKSRATSGSICSSPRSPTTITAMFEGEYARR